MSEEMMNAICKDVVKMTWSDRPRFGDMVVGDINDGNLGLLEKAISGDFKAEQDLVRMVERQRAQRREFAAELAAQQV